MRYGLRGTPVMDKKSATQSKVTWNWQIRELSSVLVLTKEVSALEEFTTIRKSIGDIMAAMDAVLYDSIYPDHPELNELRNG
jgi:hypothetical protein